MATSDQDPLLKRIKEAQEWAEKHGLGYKVRIGQSILPNPKPEDGPDAFRRASDFCRQTAAVLNAQADPQSLSWLEQAELFREAADRLESRGPDLKKPRLVIDPETNSITLDGRRFDHIDPQALRAFQTLQHARSVPTPIKRLRELIPNCHHDTTFRRWLKKLPSPLLDCITGASGKGIWLELPPLS